MDVNELMKNVNAHARKIVAEYPTLEEEIRGLLDLCRSEIEQGESAEHEIELCWSDINYLVENQ